MKEPVRHFLLAVQFLTRIPIPGNVRYSPESMAYALYQFPLVGFLLGASSAIAYAALLNLFPPVLAATLTLALVIRLTGALHEDGLADLADGLGGSPERERALEIMRDSRIGTYGTLGIVLLILSKVVALSTLEVVPAAGALIAGHVWGRSAIVAIVRWSRYARADGVAEFSQIPLPRHMLAWPILVSALAALVLCLATSPLVALAAFLAAGAIAVWVHKYMWRRLGGYTGDGLGTVETLVELVVLMAVVACL